MCFFVFQDRGDLKNGETWEESEKVRKEESSVGFKKKTKD